MIPLHDDNPTEIFPIFTILIIAICVLVFLWQLSLGSMGNQFAVNSYGVIPAVLLDKIQVPPEKILIPVEFTILTSMFLHGGFMHLIGNMLFLWIFGNNVEDSMGHVRFIIFYLVCGVVAVAGQIIQNPDSQIPMIGASGAISGVLGAYLLLFPHARVLVAIPVVIYIHMVRLPAGLILCAWFLLQILNSMSVNPETGGVAWFAHIGGFIAGMALIPLFKYKKVSLFHPAHGSRRWHKRL